MMTKGKRKNPDKMKEIWNYIDLIKMLFAGLGFI